MRCSSIITIQKKEDLELVVLISKMDNTIIIRWEERQNQRINSISMKKQETLEMLHLEEDLHLQFKETVEGIIQ